MKVLFTGALLPQRHGAALSSTELLTYLAEVGHSVSALVPTRAGSLDVEETDRTIHSGINVTRFELPFFESLLVPLHDDERSYLKTQIITGLKQALKVDRFDLIIVGKESIAPGVPSLAREAQLPCVVYSRGAILPLLRPDSRRGYAEQLLAELGEADLVVACAQYLARTLHAEGVERITAITNSVDTNRFSPGPRSKEICRKLGIPADAKVVGHASTLGAWKRPLDIVESAALTTRVDQNLIYLIIGGHEHSKREEMIEACKQLRVYDHFRFVEWQDYETMCTYMRIADIMVYPSMTEGLCRGYLECMSSGRVLISTDIPAARELVDDGVDGLLFRVGDVAELATKTLLVSDDSELRHRIGRAARAKILNRYARSQLLATHEAALDQLLQSHGSE